MRGIVFHLLPWVIVFTIGWTAGDRYGAPGWLAGLADRGFTAVENTAGGTIGGLFDRVNEPIPSDDGEDADDSAATDDEYTDFYADEDVSVDQTLEPAAGGVSENSDLTINAAGLQIIKDSEGLRLEPYSAGGYSYIGYGHQIKDGESFTSITEAEAEALLRDDLAFFENGVRESLTRPATENQFSAMVSLAYNKGLYGFRDTDVLKKFNAGDVEGAANDFRNHTGRDGPVPHLVERRERERMLFLK